MKLNVVLGQDLSAYAEIEIEAPEDSSEEEIVRRVRAFTESADFKETVFDEDWSSTCALRIVSVKNGNDYILEDVALEPSPYFGPSEEAIRAYIAKRDIEAGPKMMEPHLCGDKLDALRRWLGDPCTTCQHTECPGILC